MRQIGVATPRVAVARLARWAPPSVGEVLATLRRTGARALLVGGAVRDAFLGRRSHDWDIATSLMPGAVAALFPRVVRAGEKHGTIMVLTDDGPIEVTTFRREGPYLDGRRPESVEFHGRIEEDLARRDFTINALAADLEERRIVDPFGGTRDLGRGLVRCVGVPLERFDEDGLRPLRAVRFAGILGFRIERATREAIPLALGSFAKVSWERKRDEMTRLLAHGRGFPGIARELVAGGLLQQLAPELMPARPARLKALALLPDEEPWLRFAAWAALAGVAPETAGEVLRRWRVALRDVRRVEGWLAALRLLPGREPRGAELRRWLSRAGEETAPGAASLAEALASDRLEGFARRARASLARRPVLRLDQLAIGGADLVAAGLSGPTVGRVLRELLEAVIDVPARNRKPVLMALAHRLSTGISK